MLTIPVTTIRVERRYPFIISSPLWRKFFILSQNYSTCEFRQPIRWCATQWISLSQSISGLSAIQRLPKCILFALLTRNFRIPTTDTPLISVLQRSVKCSIICVYCESTSAFVFPLVSSRRISRGGSAGCPTVMR